MTSRQSPKLKPSPWDAVVVAAVIALGVLVAAMFYGDKRIGGPLTVVVSVAGEEVERGTLLELSGTHTYTNNGYTITVDIADGAVNVTDSTCPGHDCQHTPPISRSGQSIVCMPSQIVIHLSGASDGPDVIVG